MAELVVEVRYDRSGKRGLWRERLRPCTKERCPCSPCTDHEQLDNQFGCVHVENKRMSGGTDRSRDR